MAIKKRYCGIVIKGTLAELTALTHVYDLGTMFLPTDSDEVRVSNGEDVFDDLISMPAQALQKADHIALLGTTTNLAALVPIAATISGSAAVLSTSNTYTDAAVKTAIDTAVDAAMAKVITSLGLKADNADAETLRTQVEARLDIAEGKTDALIGSLITANLMDAT